MTIRDDNGFELMDFDPLTGRSVWSYFDGLKTVYRTDYPVDGLIKQNAELRATASDDWKGDWHRVASVPMNLHYEKLAAAHEQGDYRYVSRWLNDSDNRAFRTKEGRV